MQKKIIAVVALLFGVAVAEEHVITKEFVEKMKPLVGSSWKAYDYDNHPFKDQSLIKSTGLILNSPESPSLMTSVLKQYFRFKGDEGKRNII
jgi:predicted component of type VI protein secretion system